GRISEAAAYGKLASGRHILAQAELVSQIASMPDELRPRIELPIVEVNSDLSLCLAVGEKRILKFDGSAACGGYLWHHEISNPDAVQVKAQPLPWKAPEI